MLKTNCKSPRIILLADSDPVTNPLYLRQGDVDTSFKTEFGVGALVCTPPEVLDFLGSVNLMKLGATWVFSTGLCAWIEITSSTCIYPRSLN